MTTATCRLCVVGLGYIGLPTAAVLAARGYPVHGVDLNPATVETINAGRAHIVEPDLDMLVQAGVQTGRLRAHAEPAEADTFMLCVPTPLTTDKRPELRHVHAAAAAIVPWLRPGSLVVLESTVPPGTTDAVAASLRAASGLGPGQLHVAHAPERVLPGRILLEVIENDRVVGGVDDASTEACRAFYAGFVSGRIHTTGARTAEATKLAENAFRDVNIAFANELSLVADRLGLDVWELIGLANRHPRVNILRPGPGVGGHCIAVDPFFLIDAAPDLAPLMAEARRVNGGKPHRVVERVLAAAARFRRPRIACLGLAYKPDVDDLRESPALEVVHALAAAATDLDAEVRVCDPYVTAVNGLDLQPLDACLDGADIVLVLVAHRQFRALEPRRLNEKVVIDTCGAFVRD